jgi:glycosyltransferase involved in cell wall biosynthesis
MEINTWSPHNDYKPSLNPQTIKMKISIVTVCYNSALTIKDTLQSVALQRHKDFEHLIIDGGSKDGTLEIVRAWKGHPVRMISESDDGIYDAMNKGLTLATGDVVGFLNSDDFYADSSVLVKIANAFQDISVDACYGDLVYVSQDNSRVVRYWKSRPFINVSFAKGWCPAHPTFYVRKSAIERLGLFDRSLKLAADMEFMMRYLERGKILSVYIPDVLVKMRIGGATNQSWKNVVQQNKEIFFALEKNGMKYSKVLFLMSKFKNRLGQFIVGRFKRGH